MVVGQVGVARMDEPLPGGCILAGGRSRRFGSDKARALLEGEPLIKRLAEQLRPVTASVTVVADRAERYADLGLKTVADREPGQGPMGGLLRALEEPGPAWKLVVSCDLLELRRHWVTRLLEARQAGVGAVAFVEGGQGGRWQPFPGLYHRDLAARLRDSLREGRRAMQRMLEEVGAVAVALPSDWPVTVQANSPAELARFAKRRRRGV
ncbi:MAG: molybdenum cofactor guanylyltransferase [Phycisphaeraceae bacterium]